jgi:hypothetical protein
MLPVTLQPTGATAGLKFTAVFKFVGKPTKPAHVDPLAKERRLRLLELTKQSFPDGKVPDPFSLTWLSLSQDVAANKPRATYRRDKRHRHVWQSASIRL